jgi:hypothetical protein
MRRYASLDSELVTLDAKELAAIFLTGMRTITLLPASLSRHPAPLRMRLTLCCCGQ